MPFCQYNLRWSCGITSCDRTGRVFNLLGLYPAFRFHTDLLFDNFGYESKLHPRVILSDIGVVHSGVAEDDILCIPVRLQFIPLQSEFSFWVIFAVLHA